MKKEQKPLPSLELCINGFPCRKFDCRFWNANAGECKIVLACDAIAERQDEIVELNENVSFRDITRGIGKATTEKKKR